MNDLKVGCKNQRRVYIENIQDNPFHKLFVGWAFDAAEETLLLPCSFFLLCPNPFTLKTSSLKKPTKSLCDFSTSKIF